MPTGPHWILTSPSLPGRACVLSGSEVNALWDLGLMAGIETKTITILPVAEFLADVRKRAAKSTGDCMSPEEQKLCLKLREARDAHWIGAALPVRRKPTAFEFMASGWPYALGFVIEAVVIVVVMMWW